MNANPSKNLVLGLVKGYKKHQIEPFVKSLRHSGYQGDICFFTSELNEEAIAMLKHYDVQMLPFEDSSLFTVPFAKKKIYPFHLFYLYPFQRFYPLADTLKLFNNKLTRTDITKSFIKLLNVYSSRFLMYYLYLAEQGSNYANVMITDVRDVFFQDDPFKFDFDNNLCCFLEDSEKNIRSCSYNSTWILKGFGQQTLDEMGDNLISCSGVTIGSYPAMMSYLEAMVDRLIRHRFLKYGLDQSMHNYVIYNGLAENVKLFKNHHGPVLTMGYVPPEKMKFDSEGRMLNDDGSPINVIHQYDRHPDVEEKLMAQIN